MKTFSQHVRLKKNRKVLVIYFSSHTHLKHRFFVLSHYDDKSIYTNWIHSAHSET